MESVLNINVSRYRNYKDTIGEPVNLLDHLTSEEHQTKVEELRACKTKKERDILKAKLPAITPSGLFTSRANENLVSHTGLIQIDLDPAGGNLEIPNWENLKEELRNLENIAYLARSVSGRGYWGLIPIPSDPEKHKAYFEAIEEIFLTQYHLVIDPAPKALVSLRGYSYDPEAYFNHNAKLFSVLKTVVKVEPREPIRAREMTPWLNDWILKELAEAPEGTRHERRFKMGRLAGGYCAGGLVEESILDQMIEAYQFDSEDTDETQAKEIKALRDGFKAGKKDPITEIKSDHTKYFEDESNN
jgi:hypothetical protein